MRRGLQTSSYGDTRRPRPIVLDVSASIRARAAPRSSRSTIGFSPSRVKRGPWTGRLRGEADLRRIEAPTAVTRAGPGSIICAVPDGPDERLEQRWSRLELDDPPVDGTIRPPAEELGPTFAAPPTPNELPPRLGSTAPGQIRLLRELGKGWMSSVTLARQRSLHHEALAALGVGRRVRLGHRDDGVAVAGALDVRRGEPVRRHPGRAGRVASAQAVASPS